MITSAFGSDSQAKQSRLENLRLADIAVTKTREGQTKGLLYSMRLAKYPIIITIDADLENDPTHIPTLIQQTTKFDIVVASPPTCPETIASKT